MEYSCKRYADVDSNVLIHHGTKGQKWGRRRYQNDDGSLTAEGRDHYGVGGPRPEGAQDIPQGQNRGTSSQPQPNSQQVYSKPAISDRMAAMWNELSPRNKKKIKNAGRRMVVAVAAMATYDIIRVGKARIDSRADRVRAYETVKTIQGVNAMQHKDINGTVLVHHGILGQKWGVRRYQNPDGSYTAAGRQRYDIGEGQKATTGSYEGDSSNRSDNSESTEQATNNAPNHKGLTPKQKKRIIIGAAIVAAAAGTYIYVRKNGAGENGKARRIENDLIKYAEKDKNGNPIKDDNGNYTLSEVGKLLYRPDGTRITQYNATPEEIQNRLDYSKKLKGIGMKMPWTYDDNAFDSEMSKIGKNVVNDSSAEFVKALAGAAGTAIVGTGITAVTAKAAINSTARNVNAEFFNNSKSTNNDVSNWGNAKKDKSNNQNKPNNQQTKSDNQQNKNSNASSTSHNDIVHNPGWSSLMARAKTPERKDRLRDMSNSGKYTYADIAAYVDEQNW